jgi:altronate dehydratase large subunit
MRTFRGYARPDGTAGCRNHVAVIPTVACANGVVGLISRAVPEAVPFFHCHGCGRAGQDLELHIRTLVNLGKNPNIAGVVVVGLGCEVIRSDALAGAIAESGKPVEYIDIQREGGSLKSAERGSSLAERLLEEVALQERVEVGFDRLILGLECGGSDAFSGVTANPSVGVVADWVVSEGGTVILTEDTEMIGTERILARRACCPEVAGDILEMIEEAERNTREQLGPFASLVIAPGNMDGGMSSIQEKALGCITKGGSSDVNQVVKYGEVPGAKGLVLMDAPGYDVESMAGLAAAGTQAMLFTTGRGNPIGFPGVPVLKIASTSKLACSMSDDIDVDAGGVLEGGSIGGVADAIIGVLQRVLDGEPVKAEKNRQTGILCLYTAHPSF